MPRPDEDASDVRSALFCWSSDGVSSSRRAHSESLDMSSVWLGPPSAVSDGASERPCRRRRLAVLRSDLLRTAPSAAAAERQVSAAARSAVLGAGCASRRPHFCEPAAARRAAGCGQGSDSRAIACGGSHRPTRIVAVEQLRCYDGKDISMPMHGHSSAGVPLRDIMLVSGESEQYRRVMLSRAVIGMMAA